MEVRRIDAKAVARQAAQRIRNKLAPTWIAEASRAIQRTVLELPEVKAARRLGLYLALPREVETQLIADTARARGQELALPAWRKAEEAYGMARWPAGAFLQAAHYGIQEPVPPEWIATDELDVMIVTCLAFDAQGWRLGHGGGYFDRLLAGHRGCKICLAFECQKLVAVPCDDHDVPVNLIVTERAVYRAPSRVTYADPEAWKHK
jgi:5-formyltetrahydrofolate cyclo-ligase